MPAVGDVELRTAPGLEPRRNGERLGRPISVALHADQIRKLRRTGLSKSQIARQLNIGRTSVRRVVAASPRTK
jgi:DNA invertase Pin-like site-specific DNA recombinase